MRLEIRSVLTKIWLPILTLTAWELLVSNLFFPKPSLIVARAMEEVNYIWFEDNLLPTLCVSVFGYLLGIFFGALVGCVVGYFSSWAQGIVPFIVFLRKMPAVAKLPIILAVFGIGIFSQLFAVTLSVALMFAMVILKAIQEASPEDLTLVKLTRISRLRASLLIFVPRRSSELFSVAKSAIQVALLVTIFSETLASSGGLGAFTLQAKGLFDIEKMWIGILATGLLSAGLHGLFGVLERVFSARGIIRINS